MYVSNAVACASTDHLLHLEVHAILGVDEDAAVQFTIRQLHAHFVTLALVQKLHRDTNRGRHGD